jgi:hypothetical protein
MEEKMNNIEKMRKDTYRIQAETVIKNMKKRNFEGFYADTCEEAVEIVKSLIQEGASIGFGGTMTMKETGVFKLVSNGKYNLYDRGSAKTPEEVADIYQKHFASDYYIMSANAITMDGELVNIDGNSNRVACLCYGPKHVIVIAGMNKLTDDMDSAYKRIKTKAAPPNGVRLGLNTPCAITGKCGDCYSEGCMCANIVVTRMNRNKDRIKVILVGEELGF